MVELRERTSPDGEQSVCHDPPPLLLPLLPADSCSGSNLTKAHASFPAAATDSIALSGCNPDRKERH